MMMTMIKMMTLVIIIRLQDRLLTNTEFTLGALGLWGLALAHFAAIGAVATV